MSDLISKRVPQELEANLSGQVEQIESEIHQTFKSLEEKYISSIRGVYKLGFGEVARVGSCALLVLRKDDRLITANLGDCRAVLGTYDHSGAAILSSIKALRLTRDHNAREPEEQARLRREHPNESLRELIVCKNPNACYVKGRLQLTRAFGDAYLKYSEFNEPLGGYRAAGRKIPHPYTPPYVSAVPELSQRRLSNKDQFLILATDGVW